MKKIALMLTCAGVLTLAGSKDRDWQTGKVLDNQFNSYFAPSAKDAVANPTGTLGNTAYNVDNPTQQVQQVRDDYVIETADAVYKLERTRLKASVGANVKKYSQVKFAVEKDKVWLVDSDGKEYRTKIVELKHKSFDTQAVKR